MIHILHLSATPPLILRSTTTASHSQTGAVRQGCGGVRRKKRGIIRFDVFHGKGRKEVSVAATIRSVFHHAEWDEGWNGIRLRLVVKEKPKCYQGSFELDKERKSIEKLWWEWKQRKQKRRRRCDKEKKKNKREVWIAKTKSSIVDRGDDLHFLEGGWCVGYGGDVIIIFNWNGSRGRCLR